jgi:hypothetical protein
MKRYTIPQRVFFVRSYYKNGVHWRQQPENRAPSTVKHFENERSKGWFKNWKLRALLETRAILQQAHYLEKVNVWCGFWSGGVIGPFFLEDDREKALSTNGERYRDMIENFLWSKLEPLDVDQMWFQQDGSTSHTAGVTIELLRTKFRGRVVSCKWGY